MYFNSKQNLSHTEISLISCYFVWNTIAIRTRLRIVENDRPRCGIQIFPIFRIHPNTPDTLGGAATSRGGREQRTLGERRNECGFLQVTEPRVQRAQHRTGYAIRRPLGTAATVAGRRRSHSFRRHSTTGRHARRRARSRRPRKETAGARRREEGTGENQDQTKTPTARCRGSGNDARAGHGRPPAFRPGGTAAALRAFDTMKPGVWENSANSREVVTVGEIVADAAAVARRRPPYRKHGKPLSPHRFCWPPGYNANKSIGRGYRGSVGATTTVPVPAMPRNNYSKAFEVIPATTVQAPSWEVQLLPSQRRYVYCVCVLFPFRPAETIATRYRSGLVCAVAGFQKHPCKSDLKMTKHFCLRMFCWLKI